MKKLFGLMMIGSMALMACSENAGNGPENTGNGPENTETSSPTSKRVGEFKTKNFTAIPKVPTANGSGTKTP